MWFNLHTVSEIAWMQSIVRLCKVKKMQQLVADACIYYVMYIHTSKESETSLQRLKAIFNSSVWWKLIVSFKHHKADLMQFDESQGDELYWLICSKLRSSYRYWGHVYDLPWND
jgi:hypothetical protein